MRQSWEICAGVGGALPPVGALAAPVSPGAPSCACAAPPSTHITATPANSRCDIGPPPWLVATPSDTCKSRAYTMSAAPAAVRSAHMTAIDHPRSIRSFVTRSGRITEAQQRALAQLWPKYGVEFAAEPLDARALYGRDAPRTLEIGFGNGENLS